MSKRKYIDFPVTSKRKGKFKRKELGSLLADFICFSNKDYIEWTLYDFYDKLGKGKANDQWLVCKLITPDLNFPIFKFEYFKYIIEFDEIKYKEDINPKDIISEMKKASMSNFLRSPLEIIDIHDKKGIKFHFPWRIVKGEVKEKIDKYNFRCLFDYLTDDSNLNWIYVKYKK